MIRAQLPVHSPLPARALLAGGATLLGAGRGAERRALELLARAYPGRTLVPTDSGTSALGLALRDACDRTRGPAAIPSYCCYDIATAVDGAGVEFLLYDLDPTALGPDFDSLRRALEAGARVVVAVHLYGLPVDWPRLQALAAEFGATLIEDAAQGAGGSLEGRPLGTLGDYGVLSFGRGKGVTGGGGGALLLPVDRGLPGPGLGRPGAAASLRALVALAAQWLLARPAVYGLPSSLPWLGLGETVYREPTSPGEASRLSLAVLAHTLPLAEAEAERRREHARRLHALLAGGPLRPCRAPVGVPGFLRAPATAPAGFAERLRTTGARRLGVMPGYPLSLADLPGFGSRRRNPDEPLPTARALADTLATFPTHGWLRESDWERLAGWLAGLGGD